MSQKTKDVFKIPHNTVPSFVADNVPGYTVVSKIGDSVQANFENVFKGM